YVPELIRYYLGEEPALDNVETHRLETPDVLEWVLDHLDALVLKPVDGSGGKGIVIGPAAKEEELNALRTVVAADPRGWIAQRPVALSTAPTLVGDTIAPRHVDLRPFAVNDGNDIWVLPGGLTRVALPEGALVVNSSQGGGSKDTWVLAHDPAEPSDRDDTAAEVRGAPPLSGPFPRTDGVQRDLGPAAEYAGQQ
ncbi:MAG TPA: circularly permuted type 2 ATP-grasp protein, partial [Actinomycetes bacterium]